MKKLVAVALVLFVAGVLAGSIQAGEMTVTVEGKIVCAKCNLTWRCCGFPARYRTAA